MSEIQETKLKREFILMWQAGNRLPGVKFYREHFQKDATFKEIREAAEYMIAGKPTYTELEADNVRFQAVCRVMSKAAWDCERIVATAMRILNAVDPDEIYKAMKELDDEGA